jgi:hypothetical protein
VESQCEFGCNANLTACNPCNPALCNGVDLVTCDVRACAGTQCVSRSQCAADLCVAGACVECTVAADNCPGDQICEDNDCVPAGPPPCNPAACGFPNICNPDNTCATCDAARDCEQPANPCSIAVCLGNGTGCATAPNDGAPCGQGGICSDEICNPIDPGNGGPGNGNGGGDPGNGGGNGNGPPGLACNGTCDLLDPLLCPQDCAAQ